MANLFQIIDFKRDEGKITVFILGAKDVVIDMEDYETFLNTHDKLEYPNIPTPHLLLRGTYSIAEYWEQQTPYHILDLYEYIVAKRLDIKKATVNFFADLNAITNTFKQAI